MEPPIMTGAPDTMGADQDLIKDTTTAEFTKDVIEASMNALVLVDFWAPWCGPCKQLTPVLEKVVKQAGGAVRLVKMNIDDEPAVASQLGVQSIPAVFAFKQGQPVDGFMGALPESQIKQFIERHADPDAMGGMDEVLETAKDMFDAGEFEGAAEVYAAILGEDETHVEAIAGLAQCFISVGELDQAEETLEKTPAEARSSNLIESARAAIALARKGAASDVDTTSYAQTLENDPNNHQARFDLAMAFGGAGQKEQATDALIEIVSRNREWNNGAAQQQLLEFFAAWGPEDENTVRGRQKLSSILFA